ncbi:hypothetical protein [Parvimonas micra]|uniref:Uncharacterized protein n=1 Tax=Parvimonas micra TaxID=33033 RepID=A0A0B4S277_9FIRM|nr:hypothetical protein [Parvimonas micra]AIZ36574.1 hypothetical protein NW74_04135 [Parvimonas micra]MBF1306661.1 hypothetical protein [Parvimonas micra]
MNIAKKYFINYLWIVNFVIFTLLMFMLDYVDLNHEYIYSIDKYLFLKVLPIIDELNGGTFIIVFILYMTFSILYKINYKFLIINLSYVIFQLLAILYPVVFGKVELLGSKSILLFIIIIIIHFILIFINTFLIKFKYD